MAASNSSFQRRYPPEMRERAVRMVREAIAESGERVGAVSRVARQFGIGPESLRNWVKHADIDNGKRPGVTTADPEGGFGFLCAGARPATAKVVSFINAQRDRWGVLPICKTLHVAPSTYYAAVCREPSARQLGDERLKREIARVHRDNFGVYGIEKVWRQLNREGKKVGRDRVARLMDDMELSGVVRGKRKRTTFPAEVSARPADLVERNFTATAPNRLWVSDLTYVSTWSGFAYVAFVIDVFSRFIVGWRVSNSLHADLALDALEMAIWRRQQHDLTGLIHHSDRGVQYLSVRYTERLAEAGAVRSVGSRGDSYDNALAEAVNGLYKTDVIRKRGPWHALEQVELATAEWVDWWNHRRLHSAIGDMPPAELEALYHSQRGATAAA